LNILVVASDPKLAPEVQAALKGFAAGQDAVVHVAGDYRQGSEIARNRRPQLVLVEMTADLATLMPDVRDHEPRLALDGGPDGLDLVRRIVTEAPDHLEPEGVLAIEIGAGEAPATVALFEERGFKDVRADRDLARIERVVSGVRP